MNPLKRIVKSGMSSVLTGILGDEEGLVTMTTRRGPAKGLRFRLDLAQRSEFPYWLGKYERRSIEQIAEVCKPGMVAWDCGIYLGYYTCVLARAVGAAGKVEAFEPDPTNLARTKRNVALNGLSNVAFHHAAIAGTSGEIDLLVNAGTNSHIPGNYIGADRESYAKIEKFDSVLRVRCTTLDDAHFVDGVPRPDLIKIDIEGAEGAAIRSTGRLCREVRPLFVLELHNPDCDRAAWEWAAEQGYHLKSIETGKAVTRAEDVNGTLLCSPA